ncbi:TMEM175 family protein [Arsenicibacter rosenii]|uniref:DUF1211 domain-containing membrane protein n=1 Tax=Arsenicibacter rosenii TaxID=1750698 RepID=A0A1S2VKH9_9BACT|nr:TMEM175 family protein [Arsenicibacter rosenii]OIN59254.1 hypothetical protein BLX24_09700 [Arsenicibacter rosenii]
MEKKTARIEAFSDGIFGVAITLLAIEIGIDEYQQPTNLSLWNKIVEKWAEYFTYFNSFATVLLIWMGHHKILNKIWRANHWVILLNGLVLLFVVLFPYPTKLVGNFIDTEAINTAVGFYTGFTGLIVLTMLLLNLGIIGDRGKIINPEKNLEWFFSQIKQQMVAVLVYGIATIIAFYAPYIALSITFMMWIFWAIVTKDTDDEE